MKKPFQSLRVLLASWILVSACAREHQEFGPDSETHFLRGCITSKECGTSSCICGVCTQTCAVHSQCSSEASEAQCLTSNDPMCDANKVCDALCSSKSDCKGLGPSSTCVRGRCREPNTGTARTNSGVVDAGVGDAGATDGGPDATAHELDAAPGDAATTGPGMDASAIDDASAIHAGSFVDAGPRPENEPCVATLDCVDGLVCSLRRCRKDPCVDASCAMIPLVPDGQQPCVASTITRSPCASGTCPAGLVCHVDDTCIEPGACDSDGVATLRPPAVWNTLAIDSNYLYGSGTQNNVSRIVRLSLADLQESTLVEGRDAAAVTAAAFVDADAFYWIGPKPTIDATTLLWRYRLDGASTAENLGPAGLSLAQDEGYFYVTSPDGSVLYRAQKGAAEQREAIYNAPPGETIGSLTVNSRYVFLSESSGTSRQVVRSLDKQTLEPQLLPNETNDKMASYVDVAGLVADDDYLYVDESAFAFRFDITKGKLAVLAIPGMGGFLLRNDRLYTAGGLKVRYVDINTGDATEVYSFPAVAAANGATSQIFLSRSSMFCPNIGGRLVRVMLPP